MRRRHRRETGLHCASPQPRAPPPLPPLPPPQSPPLVAPTLRLAGGRRVRRRGPRGLRQLHDQGLCDPPRLGRRHHRAPGRPDHHEQGGRRAQAPRGAPRRHVSVSVTQRWTRARQATPRPPLPSLPLLMCDEAQQNNPFDARPGCRAPGPEPFGSKQGRRPRAQLQGAETFAPGDRNHGGAAHAQPMRCRWAERGQSRDDVPAWLQSSWHLTQVCSSPPR